MYSEEDTNHDQRRDSRKSQAESRFPHEMSFSSVARTKMVPGKPQSTVLTLKALASCENPLSQFRPAIQNVDRCKPIRLE